VGQGLSGPWPESPPMFLSLAPPAHFVESAGEMIVRVGIAAVIGQRALKGRDGKLVLPHFGQEAAQVGPAST